MFCAVVLAASLLSAVVQTDSRPTCADLESCRAAALEAMARRDYEAFHDLAWLAWRRGRPADPDLMYLVARAQSLSGRPGDALVMIRRLADAGVMTDAATSDEFRSVRELPGWADVEARLVAATPTSTVTAADAAAKSAAVSRSPAAAAAPPRPDSRTPPGVAAAPERAPGPVAPAGAADAPHAEDALRLTRALPDPVGLAYDSVSRRFLVGDRKLNKLVVVDEVFNRVTDMVAAHSAGFYGISAFAIDRPRGDLWVASGSPDSGAALHKLQLVSGRVLSSVQVPAELGPAEFTELAITARGSVLLLDRRGGRIFRLAAGSRSFEVSPALALGGPSSLAADGEEHAHVAHGAGLARVALSRGTATPVQPPRGETLQGITRIWPVTGGLVALQGRSDRPSRIVRLRLDGAGHAVSSLQVLDAQAAIVNDTMAALGTDALFYVSERGDVSVVRRVPIR